MADMNPTPEAPKGQPAAPLFRAGSLVTYREKSDVVKELTLLVDGTVMLTLHIVGQVKSSECVLRDPPPEVLPTLPWKARKPDSSNGYWYVEAANGREAAVVYSGTSAASLTANTICRAVNTHAALLSTIERAQARMTEYKHRLGNSNGDAELALSLIADILEEPELLTLVQEAKGVA